MVQSDEFNQTSESNHYGWNSLSKGLNHIFSRGKKRAETTGPEEFPLAASLYSEYSSEKSLNV